MQSERNKQQLFISKCITIAASTKNYNQDKEAYESGVLKPYNELCTMSDLIEKKKCEPSDIDIKEVYELLMKILETKKTPGKEQGDRIKLLFKETGVDEHL